MKYQTLTYIENHQDTANLFDLYDLSSVIEEGLNSLPEKTQEVFRQRCYLHPSTKDIATGLNITEKAVKYHIPGSIKSLKNLLVNKPFTSTKCTFYTK